MKKLILIFLIVLVVFSLFQAAVGGSIGSYLVQNTSPIANSPVQGVQLADCSGIKVFICAVPNVGWNS